MQYTYVAAWTVHSDTTLPENSDTIELFKSDTRRFVLTRDPDDLLAVADKGAAIGSVLLRTIVGQADAEFAVALSSATKDLLAERRDRVRGLPVLVFEGRGEVLPTFEKGRSAETEEFTVAFDALDKQELRAAHRRAIEAMKLALAFESQSRPRFAAVSEGVYLTDERGKPLYSVTFSGSAEAGVARYIGPENLRRIGERYESLQKRQDLESVQRLFSEMAVSEADRLRTFLFGWIALEILVQKAFNAYGKASPAPLGSADQPLLSEQSVQEAREGPKRTYRLTDKFVDVSAVLFPNGPEASDDRKRFSRLKKLRDGISHGEKFSEQDLPVDELWELLRRYALAYVEAPLVGVKKANA